MLKLHEINYWAFIITFCLLFTFWGGIIALPFFGLLQIGISLKIISHFDELTKLNKTLFVIYGVLTLSLFIFFKSLKIDGILFMFFWGITSMFLASFHVYITYKITKQ